MKAANSAAEGFSPRFFMSHRQNWAPNLPCAPWQAAKQLPPMRLPNVKLQPKLTQSKDMTIIPFDIVLVVLGLDCLAAWRRLLMRSRRINRHGSSVIIQPSSWRRCWAMVKVFIIYSYRCSNHIGWAWSFCRQVWMSRDRSLWFMGMRSRCHSRLPRDWRTERLNGCWLNVPKASFLHWQIFIVVFIIRPSRWKYIRMETLPKNALRMPHPIARGSRCSKIFFNVSQCIPARRKSFVCWLL